MTCIPRSSGTRRRGCLTAGSIGVSTRCGRNIFDPLDEKWWDEFTAVPAEYLDAGDQVVVIGRYRGRAKETGKQLDVPFVHIWSMSGDKAIRFRQYLDTAGWVAALQI